MSVSVAAAATLVDELARQGLRHAVLAPGSRSAPLALAFAEQAGVELHVQLDERAAAFTALGCARAGGRPAAVVTTSGTAAANLHPAVAEADQAGVPLLVLTADRPPELRATAANQTIDQIGLYGTAVRWFFETGTPDPLGGDADYWRSLAAQAYAAALGSPPGPVHLNIALREPLVGEVRPYPGRSARLPYTEVLRNPALPDEAIVERLARLIEAAPRGAIVAGALPPNTGAQVIELAERAGYVLLAEPSSSARRGSCATAHHDLLLRAPAFAEKMRPELVIRVGKHGLSRALSAWLAPEVTQVVIEPHGRWTDPDRRAAVLLAAGIDETCGALAGALARRGPNEWLEAWLEADRRAAEVVEQALPQGVSEPGVARTLAAALPGGAVLLAGSSMPVRYLDSFMAPRDGLTVLANRGANGIDGLVSTALGAALAHDGPVAALLGDLALLHDANALLLDDRPNCVLVVLNNDGGGIFSFLPQAGLPRHFERLFATPHGLDLGALARAYRVEHHLLTKTADLSLALQRAFAAGGVHLIEARTERDSSAQLLGRIAGEVAAALG